MDNRYSPPRHGARGAPVRRAWLRYLAILLCIANLVVRLPDLLFQTTIAAFALPSLGSSALGIVDWQYILPSAVALAALLLPA